MISVSIDEHVLVSVPSESTSLNGSVVVREINDSVQWSPSNNGQFSIPEPSGGSSVEQSSIEVGDSLGEFASWDSSSQIGDLLSNSLGSLSGSLFSELVVDLVLGSEKLDGIQVAGVLGENNLGDVEHLRGEDLVSEKVVSEQSGIAVGEVVALVEGDIGPVSELLVEEGVLSVGGVQVLSGVLISSVLSHDVLEDLHGEEVGVSVAWGLEEDSDVDVGQLIISHEHGGWGVVWFFRIVSLSWGVGGGGSE